MIDGFLHGLESVFTWLLQASWQASVLVALVLLLQVALRGRLNPRWHHALWLLVVLRLVLPVLPESALSLFQFTPQPLPAITHSVTEPIFVAVPVEPVVPSYTAAPTPAYPFSLYTILALIWLAGALGFLLVTWMVNDRFARHVRNSPVIDDHRLLEIAASAQAELGVRRSLRLIESTRINSPAIMGIFHHTLLLPAEVRSRFSDEELRFIFLHEFAHLKRGDLVVQWLIALLQILHWFNPVLWYAFRRMRIDREPATDALVLSRTGEAEKDRYGHVLIKLLEHYHQRHSLPTLVGILEDKDQFKRRFQLIGKFTSSAYGWSLLGLFLIAILGISCLTKSKAATTAPTTAPRTDANKTGVGLMVEVRLRVVQIDDIDYQANRAEIDAAVSRGESTPLVQLHLGNQLRDLAVLTKSGEQGVLEAVRVIPVPIKFVKDADGTMRPTDHQRRNVGIRFVEEPTLHDDQIQIKGRLTVSSFQGWFSASGVPMPIFNVRDAPVSETFRFGQTRGFAMPGGAGPEPSDPVAVYPQDKPPAEIRKDLALRRVFYFITTTSVAAADAPKSSPDSASILADTTTPNPITVPAGQVYLKFLFTEISEQDYQAHRSEVDAAVAKLDLEGLKKIVPNKVISQPAIYAKYGKKAVLAIGAAGGVDFGKDNLLMQLDCIATPTNEKISLTGKWVVNWIEGDTKVGPNSYRPNVKSEQPPISEVLIPQQWKALRPAGILVTTPEGGPDNGAPKPSAKPPHQNRLFGFVAAFPGSAAPDSTSASPPPPAIPASDNAHVQVLAIDIPESDYQANREQIDDAVHRCDHQMLEKIPHARVITAASMGATTFGHGCGLISGSKNPCLAFICTPTRVQDKIHLNGNVNIDHNVWIDRPGMTLLGQATSVANFPFDGTVGIDQPQAIPEEGILEPIAAQNDRDRQPYRLFLFYSAWPETGPTEAPDHIFIKAQVTADNKIVNTAVYADGSAVKDSLPPQSDSTISSPNTGAPTPAASKNPALDQQLIDLLRDGRTEKVGKGDADQVAKLLAQGADPNAEIEKGRSALVWALNFGKDDAAQLLIKAGADGSIEDTSGENAVWLAAKIYYCPGALDLLIKKGVKVTGQNKNGQTILVAMMSVRVGTPGKMNYINDRPWTDAEYQSYLQRERHTTELLIAAGAETNGHDGSPTPLTAAIRNRHVETARILIQHGVNLTFRDVYGAPLSLAKQYLPELVPVIEAAQKGTAVIRDKQ